MIPANLPINKDSDSILWKIRFLIQEESCRGMFSVFSSSVENRSHERDVLSTLPSTACSSAGAQQWAYVILTSISLKPGTSSQTYFMMSCVLFLLFIIACCTNSRMVAASQLFRGTKVESSTNVAQSVEAKAMTSSTPTQTPTMSSKATDKDKTMLTMAPSQSNTATTTPPSSSASGTAYISTIADMTGSPSATPSAHHHRKLVK